MIILLGGAAGGGYSQGMKFLSRECFRPQRNT